MSSGRTGTPSDWARYWRAGRQPIEAMHAHFSSHVYHRHSRDTDAEPPARLLRQPADRRRSGRRSAGCSRYAAYRAFSATFGLAPSDYQRQLRLRAARRLLGMGRPAAQAAAEAGFADRAHLTRWFRRVYGVTPGAYRRAAR